MIELIIAASLFLLANPGLATPPAVVQYYGQCQQGQVYGSGYSPETCYSSQWYNGAGFRIITPDGLAYGSFRPSCFSPGDFKLFASSDCTGPYTASYPLDCLTMEIAPNPSNVPPGSPPPQPYNSSVSFECTQTSRTGVVRHGACGLTYNSPGWTEIFQTPGECIFPQFPYKYRYQGANYSMIQMNCGGPSANIKLFPEGNWDCSTNGTSHAVLPPTPTCMEKITNNGGFEQIENVTLYCMTNGYVPYPQTYPFPNLKPRREMFQANQQCQNGPPEVLTQITDSQQCISFDTPSGAKNSMLWICKSGNQMAVFPNENCQGQPSSVYTGSSSCIAGLTDSYKMCCLEDPSQPCPAAPPRSVYHPGCGASMQQQEYPTPPPGTCTGAQLGFGYLGKNYSSVYFDCNNPQAWFTLSTAQCTSYTSQGNGTKVSANTPSCVTLYQPNSPPMDITVECISGETQQTAAPSPWYPPVPTRPPSQVFGAYYFGCNTTHPQGLEYYAGPDGMCSGDQASNLTYTYQGVTYESISISCNDTASWYTLYTEKFCMGGGNVVSFNQPTCIRMNMEYSVYDLTVTCIDQGTRMPTVQATSSPTFAQTAAPVSPPTSFPTFAPVFPTPAPIPPTFRPTRLPTRRPSKAPTDVPQCPKICAMYAGDPHLMRSSVGCDGSTTDLGVQHCTNNYTDLVYANGTKYTVLLDQNYDNFGHWAPSTISSVTIKVPTGQQVTYGYGAWNFNVSPFVTSGVIDTAQQTSVTVMVPGSDVVVHVDRWMWPDQNGGTKQILTLNVCSSEIKNGVAVDGCAPQDQLHFRPANAGSSDGKRMRRQLITEHPECADLPQPFKDNCNIDFDSITDPIDRSGLLNQTVVDVVNRDTFIGEAALK